MYSNLKGDIDMCIPMTVYATIPSLPFPSLPNSHPCHSQPIYIDKTPEKQHHIYKLRFLFLYNSQHTHTLCPSPNIVRTDRLFRLTLCIQNRSRASTTTTLNDKSRTEFCSEGEEKKHRPSLATLGTLQNEMQNAGRGYLNWMKKN